MHMNLVFGVKTDDLEEAREWVERATALKAEAGESVELGDDYYLFRGDGDEQIRLISNVDIYDGEPIFTETLDWKVAARLIGTNSQSPVLRGLEQATDHFEKLEEVTYED